ncbi:MAG: aldo/keto reductase [Acidobacteriota bacterium]|nr:aldo/keto reductase [Blastocatellia bacterium]MDW8411374.1 aldo/keto reductase [Acidobacteriota bacterium]
MRFAALPEVTEYFGRRHKKTAEGHFRKAQGLTFSSIGLGSYLGREDAATDKEYEAAVLRALELGCNHYDTAINYRGQRSERAIGAALHKAFAEGKASRQEVIVATKVGYLSVDAESKHSPREYIRRTFLDTGVCKPQDIVAGCHCMTPNYIRHQLDRSLKNLGLYTIDIYYLHNPETQLSEVSRKEFLERIRRAFETLEEAVVAEKICYYGTATWNGYRVSPKDMDYLSLQELVDIAREVAGDEHHFRFIQLPYNLLMSEAFVFENQTTGGGTFSILAAAQQLGISVIASASIMQARLARSFPAGMRSQIQGLKTDAQRAIQFVRSTPGITAALVGMSKVAHVEENLQTATVPPMSAEQVINLLQKQR